MSADDSDGDGGPGRREIAHRVFAAEFDDATVSYRESDEERAPNYVVTPTGARANRLFAVGVLTEVEAVNDDVVRARVADPTGAFVSYAGQYQPDALAFFERTEPPAFVALTGKARTFEPDDGDRIYASVRPESVSAVDAETRDRWVVAAAEATVERVALFERALAADARGDALREHLLERGHPESLAAGIPIAIERYGTTPAYLEAVRRAAVAALELVAGDRDAVEGIDLAPGEGGDAEIGPTLSPAVGTADDGGGATSTADAGATADDSSPGQSAAGGGDASPEVDEEREEGTATETTTEATPEAATEGAARASDEAAADAGTVAAGDADDGGEPDTLGDFDAGETDTDEPSSGVDEDEMYELDEEERREVREEFGTEFETGTEVDGPGEADIDAPDPAESGTGGSTGESVAEAGSEEVEAEPEAEVESEDGGDADAEADAETDDAGAAASEGDVDLVDAAVAAMEALDDGDGADREAVVASVVDDHGADPGAVEDAVQDALMSGRCYEPNDGTLKPI